MPSPESPTRADARRNREALLAAATEVMGERGLDAPLDEIAKRARVANATLYRHFPERRELLIAVFVERMAEYAAAVREALEDEDPWAGFASYVRRITAIQASDQALADLVITIGPSCEDPLEDLRRQSYADFIALVAKAKEEGSLRSDFESDDLPLILMANAGLVHRAGEDATAASARLASIVLDGLRAEAASEGSAPPIGESAVVAAMRRLASERSC